MDLRQLIEALFQYNVAKGLGQFEGLSPKI